MRIRSLLYLLLIALPLGACALVPLLPLLPGFPGSVGPLSVDAGADLSVAENAPVLLTATVTGGSPPYRFRWSVEVQPEGSDVDLADINTNATLDLGSELARGRHVFRVRVTDAVGATDRSFTTVSVGGDMDITASAPGALGIVGESMRIDVTINADTSGLENRSIQWEVVDGDAELASTTVANPALTILAAETIHLRVTVTGERDGIDRIGVDDVYVVGIPNDTPQVTIANSGGVSGDIVLELLTTSAPNTCANFLRYVDDGAFDGIVWHRVVSGFVIQGGAFERVDGELVMRQEDPPTIESEASNGLSNTRATVAMALRGQDADSGTRQFFVNLNDNSMNLDTGPPPFTVFANVVEGMDVVDEIAGVEVGSDSNMSDVPVEDVIMVTVRRWTEEDEPDDESNLAFESTGSDTAARFFHAGSRLASGLVMITGGMRIDPIEMSLVGLADVSFFDPTTGEFSDSFTPQGGGANTTPTLLTARSSHTQTTLPDGRVLITGGHIEPSGTDPGDATEEVEIFDPQTGTIEPGDPMLDARAAHSATLLPNGDVVVAGGGDDTWQTFTPGSDTWSPANSLAHSRKAHAALLLESYAGTAGDDRVLLIGGSGSGPETMELLNPADGTTELLGSVLDVGVDDLAAIVLADGRVFISGGQDAATGDTISDVYLLDPVADTIDHAPSMPNRQGGISDHRIARSERYVVIFGGEQELDDQDTELDYAALFDTQEETWIEDGSMLNVHDDFVSVSIGDCSVLIIGGGIPLLGQEAPSQNVEILQLTIPDECLGG